MVDYLAYNRFLNNFLTIVLVTVLIDHSSFSWTCLSKVLKYWIKAYWSCVSAVLNVKIANTCRQICMRFWRS